MTDNNPTLLTLSIDAKSQLFFNDLRQQHFPAERNYLDAHLMLFHNLSAAEQSIPAELKTTAERTPLLTLDVVDVVCIGRGVAYKISSPQLMAIHHQLQQHWKAWLIPQDQQKLWPHITIQNKADHFAAKALAQALKEDFEPFTITGTGFALWEYLGGPWKFLSDYKFEQL